MNGCDLFFDRLPGSELYDVEEEVGHGTYSEVHRARSKASGGVVALKHMPLQQPGVLPLHVQREVDALQALHHPNIVPLLDTLQQGHGICLVLQYCVGSLYDALRRADGRPLDPPVTKAVMRALLHALQACHAAGLVHRDVSPTNLLFDGQGGVRLADFGHARAVPPPKIDAQGQGALTPGVGTRWYMAPEILFGSRQYTAAVDLWSAGCVMAELLAGRPLFCGASDIDHICQMMAALGSIDEAAWPGVRELPDWGKLAFPRREPKAWAEMLPGAPPEAVALLQGLLAYDPGARPSAAEALQSEYFSQGPAAADDAAVAAAVQALLTRPRRPPGGDSERDQPAPPLTDDTSAVL